MAGLGVYVQDSSGKGKGLFAGRDFCSGDVIFTEKPVVSCQFSWNKLYKYLACDHCMKSLETAEDVSRRLCQDESIVLPHPECCEVNRPQHVTCPYCDVAYCSENCRSNAYKEYHQTLCLCDKNNLRDDLLALDETWRQMHYPPETANIMLIARMIARVKQAEDKERIIKDFTSFCSATENTSENIIHKLLGEKFAGQIDVLLHQLRSFMYEDAVRDWFTEPGFRSLLGMLGTNQQGIGSSSLSTWVKNCDNLAIADDARVQLDAFIDELYGKIEEVSGDFINCEGVGLYRLQSACNHSCDPEAEIVFEHSDSTLTLKALKDISSGSEIHISYLGECELHRSRHSRQKVLAENYLFHCCCLKCVEQSCDSDRTSDESESDDSECG